MPIHRIALLALCVGIGGCATTQTHIDAIRPQAAFDLKCSNEQLRFTEITPGQVYGVEGCGKRAKYVGVSGNWVLNKEDASGQ